MKIISCAALGAMGLVLSMAAMGCARAVPAASESEETADPRGASKTKEKAGDDTEGDAKTTTEVTPVGERPSAGPTAAPVQDYTPPPPAPAAYAPVTPRPAAPPAATSAISQCVATCMNQGRGNLNQCSQACSATCSVLDPNCTLFDPRITINVPLGVAPFFVNPGGAGWGAGWGGGPNGTYEEWTYDYTDYGGGDPYATGYGDADYGGGGCLNC